MQPYRFVRLSGYVVPSEVLGLPTLPGRAHARLLKGNNQTGSKDSRWKCANDYLGFISIPTYRFINSEAYQIIHSDLQGYLCWNFGSADVVGVMTPLASGYSVAYIGNRSFATRSLFWDTAP
jgi:hypothetical protein